MKEKRDKIIVLLCMVGLVVIEIFGFNIINSVRHSQEQLNNDSTFAPQNRQISLDVTR